jgi:hypothetical protein
LPLFGRRAPWLAHFSGGRNMTEDTLWLGATILFVVVLAIVFFTA